MDAGQVVNPPPQTSLAPFPVATGVGFAVLFTAILVIVASRFDQSKGVLTLSILIVISFAGTVAYCLIFTIPTDEVTPAVVGGLTAGFGAVCAHWLGRTINGANGHAAPPENGAKD